MPTPVTTTAGVLDDRLRAAVEALGADVSAADAATALSEDAVLRLRTGGPDVTHLSISTATDLAATHLDGPHLDGYAQLVATPDGLEGELLVAPGSRRRGLGRALLDAVTTVAAGRPTRLWSHGDTPGAAALAASTGWRRSRELLRLERPVAGLLDLPVPELPHGLTARAFRPGPAPAGDDEAWVALNAAAFASHPEQGRWTVRDLRLRQAEAWFDPEVFLVLQEPDGALVAFCWMKVEPHAAELYVLGVAPGHGGGGLGRALLVRGLRAVVGDGGPDVVELYVDGDNEPAVRLYEGLGFDRAAVDVQYTSPGG